MLLSNAGKKKKIRLQIINHTNVTSSITKIFSIHFFMAAITAIIPALFNIMLVLAKTIAYFKGIQSPAVGIRHIKGYTVWENATLETDGSENQTTFASIKLTTTIKTTLKCIWQAIITHAIVYLVDLIYIHVAIWISHRKECPI